MQSKYFMSTVNKSTRIHSATCLDHIWISSAIHIKSGVIYYVQTDLCPTFKNLNPNSVNVNKYINFSFTPYSETNIEKLIEQLTNIEET